MDRIVLLFVAQIAEHLMVEMTKLKTEETWKVLEEVKKVWKLANHKKRLKKSLHVQ